MTSADLNNGATAARLPPQAKGKLRKGVAGAVIEPRRPRKAGAREVLHCTVVLYHKVPYYVCEFTVLYKAAATSRN